MSSTNINIGFGEGRVSSRVLKPPGGGHSDIFGVPDEEKPRLKKNAATEISTCFGIQEKVIIPTPEIIKIEEPKQVNKKELIEIEPLKPEEHLKQAPPPRVRVPPGGFSSGLW